MRILVDADACPVKEIIVRLAKQRGIPVIMLINTSHQLNDGRTKGPTKRTKEDNDRFEATLIKLLEVANAKSQIST